MTQNRELQTLQQAHFNNGPYLQMVQVGVSHEVQPLIHLHEAARAPEGFEF